MQELKLDARGLSKVFHRRKVFSGISFSLATRGSLAVTGRNGSGKSTLIKILAGVLSPTRGEVQLMLSGKPVPPAERFAHIGLVSPYLQLYDEFTAWENLDLFRKIRAVREGDDYLLGLLERLRLLERKDEPVRTYSSGMKQRLKYAFALLHRPPVLLLDEPTSNLDAEGILTVGSVMAEQKERGILIVATNDAEDLKQCTASVNLDAEVSP
jgi:heme exporter protein A